MASGRQHDRATRLLALPFGLLWWPAQGPAVALTAAVSFLLGGLWLSPDLDTRSLATYRWGPLAPLWWPYRRCLSHRSALSHSPLLGSALLALGWLLLRKKRKTCKCGCKSKGSCTCGRSFGCH